MCGRYNRETATRATLRVNEKDRVTGTYLLQDSCNCFDQIALGARAPDGTSNRRVWPLNMLQVGWTRVQNSRLLVEGRFGLIDGHLTQSRDHIAPNAIPILDQGRNYQYGAPAFANNIGTQDFASYQGYGSASYVTGSHSLKFGMQLRKMSVVNDVPLDVGDGVGYVFNGSAPGATPVSLSYFVVPYRDESFNQQHALYAQDQWVVRRVTLNLGLRFEYFKAYYPAQDQAAGPYVPARSFPAVDNAARLTDLNPRLGLAWNVFGDGRTAIKVATGRFQPVQAISNALTANLNPIQSLSTTATRNWTDDGDYIPEENELGALSNSNFGKPVVTQTWDRDVTNGFGNLPYSWQSSVTLSHELRAGLAVNVGYYRTTNGNFTTTDNTLRGVEDYDTFCLTAPTHADLPGGGGYQICGIQDVNPAKASAVQNVVKQASEFGSWSNIYNGFDITSSARFSGGGFLTGGVSIGRTTTDNCEVVAKLPESGAAPQQNCRSTPPWMSGTDFKISFGHDLPWAFRGTVNYQNTPGIATTATWNVPNSVIAPVLGRNLSACRPGVACTATLSVPLVQNNSLYLEDRITLLNFAVSRDFNLHGVTVRPRFQLDNSLNVNPVITVNNTFGNTWQQARGVLPPRTAKIAVQMDF